MSAALQADIAWQFNEAPKTLAAACALATKAKDEGNKCFKARAYERAVAFYRTGLAKLRAAVGRKLPDPEGGGEALATRIEV